MARVLAVFFVAMSLIACSDDGSLSDAGVMSAGNQDARVDDAPARDAAVDAATSVDVAAHETTPDVDPACQSIPTNATRTVHLRITADNECEVFVNGTSVGMTNSWPSPVTIDVSLFVHPGQKNVIAVRGTNTSSQDGPDRGVIGEIDSLSDGGATPVIVTDRDWRSSKIEVAGWTDLAFDDSEWVAATEVGNHGDAPWGALLGTSNAKWIWSAPVPVSTADKPNLETAYFRRGFYFAADGSSILNTPGCP